MAHTTTFLRLPPLARPSLGRRLLAISSLVRQRQDLAALDDAALRDIGVTRREARSEAARPAWDVPEYWHG